MHSTPPRSRVHQNPLEAARRDAVRAFARLVELQDVRDGFDAFEEGVLAVANDLCCRVLARRLQQIADGHGDEVHVRGRTYRRHADGLVEYHGVSGPVRVRRCSYRLVGVRNGPTIVPLELDAGLIDGFTPALAHSVAHGLAEMPSRRYEEVMRAARRVPPSRSTVERVAKGIGNQVKQDVLALEAIVRAEETLPDGAHALSIGLDRTTVPMAEERPPGAPAQGRRKRRVEPYERKPPHPVDVCYRMAYVGTVAVVDANGEALVTRKYGATAEEGPDELVERVMADVTALRAQRALPVIVVQDGAAELWGLMWTALRGAGIKWRQAIDRFHVVEHIAQALDELPAALVPSKEAAMAYWRQRLEKSDRAVANFAAWLFRVAHDKPCWKRVASHQGYLEGWAQNGSTRYRSLKLAGFPTASGVTEGACKSLITTRFKRSGQRWQQDGLTAILTLRAMRESDRLDRVWPFFQRRFQCAVQSAA